MKRQKAQAESPRGLGGGLSGVGVGGRVPASPSAPALATVALPGNRSP